MSSSMPGTSHRSGHSHERVAGVTVTYDKSAPGGKGPRTSFQTSGSQTFNSGIALNPMIRVFFFFFIKQDKHHICPPGVNNLKRWRCRCLGGSVG